MRKEQKTEFLSSRVRYIPINDIRPNPQQPRRRFDQDGLRELSESIAAYGILQPLTVRAQNGGYELVAGERRWRAARMAGLRQVPCLLARVDEEDAALLALIENLQRRDLDYMEEASAIARLLRRYGLSQQQAAEKLGRSQSAVANKLRILKLTPAVKAAIMANRLTERHARTLLRIQDPRVQLQLIDQIRRESLSVKATEDLVERILDKQYYDQEHLHKKRISGFVRDGRLLMNDIKKLVKQVSDSGLPANYQVRDAGMCFEVMVTIPKQPLQKAQ